jgi:hypothetical protein
MINAVTEAKIVREIAAASSIGVSTGLILPIRRGITDQSNAYNKGVYVEGPMLSVRVLPFASLPFLSVTLKITEYALDGSWNNTDFLTDYPPETRNITAQLIANSGILQLDMRFYGPFVAVLTINNPGIAPISTASQMLVFSDNSIVVSASTSGTSPDGYHDSEAPRILKRAIDKTNCPVCHSNYCPTCNSVEK